MKRKKKCKKKKTSRGSKRNPLGIEYSRKLGAAIFGKSKKDDI